MTEAKEIAARDERPPARRSKVRKVIIYNVAPVVGAAGLVVLLGFLGVPVPIEDVSWAMIAFVVLYYAFAPRRRGQRRRGL